MNGQIDRNVEPDQLRQRLASLIVRPRSTDRSRDAGYPSLS
jgi:hypothetical protein